MNVLKRLLAEYAQYQKFSKLNQLGFPIGFYSEMGSDRIYFEEMIRILVEEHHQPVLYLTSSYTDPMLEYQHPDFHTVMIGSGLFRNIAFRELKVKVFVMPLPDLETYELKRSIHPVHYVYVFHSLVSTHMTYRAMAFDAYDTILCVGPHHEAEIREAEKLFGLKPKSLLPHGYPRIEKIMQDYQHYQTQPNILGSNASAKVLIAPSWGENSITDQCLQPLIQCLLEEGLAVTYRPHPMSTRNAPEHIDELKKRFGQHPGFSLDLDISQCETLFSADLMISDWSGVALEFALVTEKPILFIDLPRKLNNANFHLFGQVPVEVSLREQLGLVLSPAHIAEAPRLVRQMLETTEQRAVQISNIRQQLIYNFGNSSNVGATAVTSILAGL